MSQSPVPIAMSPWILVPGIAFSQVCIVKAGASLPNFDAAPGAVDLTGYSFKASAKIVADEETAPSHSDVALFDFTCTVTTPQTGSNTGKVTFSLTADEVDAIADDLRGVLARFDVIMRDASSNQSVLFGGFAKLHDSITVPF